MPEKKDRSQYVHIWLDNPVNSCRDKKLIQIDKSNLLNKNKGKLKCKIKQKRLTDKLYFFPDMWQ